MRFALVDQAKKDFPVHRLCRVPGVSQSGYFAWKDVQDEVLLPPQASGESNGLLFL